MTSSHILCLPLATETHHRETTLELSCLLLTASEVFLALNALECKTEWMNLTRVVRIPLTPYFTVIIPY